MEGIRSPMDVLARCSQPPNDNAISTDISISEAFDSNATGPAGDIFTDKLTTLLNIPRAELDVFNGDPSEYHTFMFVFDENIDSKIDDPQIKLTRLIQYTKGAAKTAIKNCILIGALMDTVRREVFCANASAMITWCLSRLLMTSNMLSVCHDLRSYDSWPMIWRWLILH